MSASTIGAAEHPLVLVTWRDAFFDFERDAGTLDRADYLVRTVGFLLELLSSGFLSSGSLSRTSTGASAVKVTSMRPCRRSDRRLLCPDGLLRAGAAERSDQRARCCRCARSLGACGRQARTAHRLDDRGG